MTALLVPVAPDTASTLTLFFATIASATIFSDSTPRSSASALSLTASTEAILPSSIVSVTVTVSPMPRTDTVALPSATAQQPSASAHSTASAQIQRFMVIPPFRWVDMPAFMVGPRSPMAAAAGTASASWFRLPLCCPHE